MKLTRRHALTVTAGSLVMSGLSAAALAAPAKSAFDAEIHRFLAAYWQLLPQAAVESGQYAAAARLPAPTEADRLAQIAFCDAWLKRLAKLGQGKKALSASQQGDLALLDNQLQSMRWQLTTLRADQWDPSGYNVAMAFGELLNKDFAPLKTRLALVDKRLQQVPAYYRAALAQIKAPSPAHLRLAIEQNEGALDTFRSEIPKAMAAAKLDAATAKRFSQHNAAALASVEAFVAALKQIEATQMADGTGRSFRLGKALFEAKFGYDIQATVDANTLYQRALAEKTLLHERMGILATQLWSGLFPGETPPADRIARIARVIDKLSERHTSPAAYIDTIKAQIPALAAWVTAHDLLTLDPSRPLVVRETPTWMRGVAGASISAPGPMDPKGATYYNVDPLDAYTPEKAESFLREYNHWTLQVLSIHEAVPGHYVQLLYSNKSASKVKSLFGNGAMIEGWAVYGERMMMESGYDPSPEMGLMYAKWNLRTVCNAILDHAVHVDGISEADAMNLLEREAFQSHTEATGKWRRVQVSSVQLSSYFAGFSDILALREQLKGELGPRFDLKAFHEEFLSYGSAPVKMVSRLMRAKFTALK
jgi:uncharacterized protein (DUF885 family)